MKRLILICIFFLIFSASVFAYYIQLRFAQALLDNDLKEASRLIELGLEIDNRFPVGDRTYENLMPDYSPLMYCMATGKFEMAKLLINNGAELNFKEESFGNSALSLAVKYENPELVELLLKKGANPNISAIYFGPVLFTAILKNNYSIFKLLTDYHADIFYKHITHNNEIETALDKAEFSGSRKIAIWLKKAGVTNSYNPQGKEEIFIQAAKDNDIQCVKKYIERGIDPNYKDKYERTALQWAVMYGYEDMVNLLLKQGADLNISQKNNNFIPLLTAADNGDLKLVKLLLDKGIDIDIQDRFGFTALMLGCKEQNTKTVKYLLDRGADPSKKTTLGQDAFWYAFEKRNYEILEILINHKCYMNSYYFSKYSGSAPYFPATALYQAIYYDDFEMAEFLIDHGADVNIPNNIGLSPLSLAVVKNNYALTEILLKNKADVNYLDKKEHSVLYYAEKLNNSKIIKLLKRSIREYAGSDFKENRLLGAIDADDLEYIRLLVDQGADVNQKINSYTPLMIACEQGNLEIVEYLLSKKADINAIDKEGKNTPLIYAAANGHPKVVELLIKHNANINIKNFCGLTALDLAVVSNNIEVQAVLHAYNALQGDLVNIISKEALLQAVKAGNYEFVNIAIKNKKDIEIKDHVGSTLLIHAAESGYVNIVELLIKSGANLNTQNDFGKTALMAAVDEGQLETASVLIKNKADLEVKDKYMETALSIACEWGYFAIAKILVENKADVNIKDEYNETLLDRALQQNYNKISILLAKSIKEFDKPGTIGFTPLMHASWNGLLELSQLLIERGANINFQDKSEHESALYLASSEGHLDIVKLLVQKGAKIDIQNKEGKTPLMTAIEEKKIEIVAFLLSKGADPNKKSVEGKTALDFAKEKKNEEIIKLLLKAGAKE
jgi:ankyrin repeat protein